MKFRFAQNRRLLRSPIPKFSTSSFLLSTSRANACRAFTLIELLVVMGIISLLLVAVIPAVTSLSKAHGQKAAISNVMNLFEQARSLAVSAGNATYIVFADEKTPESYRHKAYIVFKEDPTTFSPVAVTKWYSCPLEFLFCQMLDCSHPQRPPRLSNSRVRGLLAPRRLSFRSSSLIQTEW